MDTSLVERIAHAAASADGAGPLDEATLLTLSRHPERVRSWVREDGFALVVDDDLTLVVAPDARGRGVGTALLEQALGSTAGPLGAWSHADHPAAARLAATHGFDRVRELWVMRRDLADPLPPLRDVPGVSVRGYRPDDADDVLRVNAAAFAHHPEQGGMDAANLADRMSQDWFDPAGLLLAHEGDRLLAFHWTKRHDARHGEVYVVGVAPEAQGRGLGRLVTLAGLHHLRDGGATEVLLYVESDNAPAVATYSGLGFAHARTDTHVRYVRAG
ncbi:MAG: mycothiol synthase [Nocardioides sp.]